MSRMSLVSRSLVFAAVLAAPFLAQRESALAASPKATVQFNRDIRPILSDKCFYCHGPDKHHRKGKLRLDIREEALAREAFVPGKPDASELVRRIFTTDADDVMPPADAHKELTPNGGITMANNIFNLPYIFII